MAAESITEKNATRIEVLHGVASHAAMLEKVVKR
jgi:hypothetical protein